MSSFFPQLTPSGIRFFVKKIANSKKEVQVSIIDNSITSYETGMFSWFNLTTGTEHTNKTHLYNIFTSLATTSNWAINQNEYELVISVGEGKYIPILNSLFVLDPAADNSDVNGYHMVYKTNEAIPATIKKNQTIDILILKSEYLNQEVFYAGKRPPIIKKFGNPLITDYSQTIPYQKEKLVEDFENFNELTGSVGKEKLIHTLSSSLQERLVDYSDFKNFVHFGSAEQRIKNYKTKVADIENLQINISKSLYTTGQSDPDTSDFNPSNQESVTSIRSQYFNELRTILNGFTDYEKFLYYDNQINFTGSSPGIGMNYIESEPLVTSDAIEKKADFEGFPYAYFISASTDKEVAFTAGKYMAEGNHFNNQTGSFYLSFLMKASGSFDERFKHINTQTSSLVNYPENSLNVNNILKPSSTGSEYRRYVFAASASYWLPNTGYQISHPGGNPITDWSSDSNQVKIIKEGTSVTGSLVQGFGDYANLLTTPVNAGESITGSFVPKGDLFNISIKDTSIGKATSAVVTDIKVTKTNPLDFLPFAIQYSVSSSTFNNWYDGILSSASFFDTHNIHRLYNNIPPTFQTMDTETSNRDMLQYVDMMGEFFDEYKVLIDDYYRVFDLGFSDYEMVPPKFNALLANSLGYDFLSEQSGSILEKFGLFDSFSSEQKEYNNKLFNNILNNIHYIYKSKGTDNSIRALLNCYGLPSNVLKIKETGQNLKSYEQTFLSNDTHLTAVNKLSEMTGSVSFEQYTEAFFTLIMHPMMNLTTEWNSSNVISQSAVEGVFKMETTPNTMSLFSSKVTTGGNDLWRVIVIPSGSSQPKKAKVKFQLNKSNKGVSPITTHGDTYSIETPYLDILDSKLTNILIQKSASLANAYPKTGTYDYELIVGKLDGERLKFVTGSKIQVAGGTLAGGRANQNWLSGSINQFYICPDYTGSVAEVRSWKEPLSVGAFKQHVYNPKNIVGNHFSSSLDDLEWHYYMGENYKSGSDKFEVIDVSPNTPDYTIVVDKNLFNSQSFWYDMTTIETFNFPLYGSGAGTLVYNENSILIPDTFTLKDDLRYDQSVIKQNHDLLSHDIINTPQLDFSRSPQNVINDFLKDNLGNLDFNDLFADPRDEFEDSYEALDKFNHNLINKFDISININKFKRGVSRIFNSSLIESTKKMLPARAKLIDGLVLKPTYTERIKIKPLKERPSVEKLGDNEGVLPDTSWTFTPGEEHKPYAYSFNDLDADFEETFYPWYENKGDSTGIILDAREYPDRIFDDRPELSWGTTLNDTHFVSHLDAGINNDYNTGYYETQDVFHMIGDIEFISGSLHWGLPQIDYMKDSTFKNKKLLKTSDAVASRELGTTLQYVSVNSSSYYGKLIDNEFRRPQNHHTTFGGHSHMNLGRIYEGYQHRGDIDNNTYSNNTKVSYVAPAVSDLAHKVVVPKGAMTDTTSKLAYEDLTTQAFYRIQIDNKGKGKLKVIRNDEIEGTAS